MHVYIYGYVEESIVKSATQNVKVVALTFILTKHCPSKNAKKETIAHQKECIVSVPLAEWCHSCLHDT